MQFRNITMVALPASPAPPHPATITYATAQASSSAATLPACFNESAASIGVSNRTLSGGGPGAISAEERLAEQVKWAIMDVTVPIVCALGLVGNLLSLVVLTTEKLHRTLTKMEVSAHIGLIALAVSDFLFCLLVLAFTQVSFKPFYEEGDGLVYFEFLANGLITIFIISSTWLIVVMAAERYIAVCHPLRARKLISLRRTRTSIVLVFVACALATVPIFLEKSIEPCVTDGGRRVLVVRARSEQWVTLRRILWALCFDFIPCAALVYFNLCLIVQIRRAKRLREQMTPQRASMLRWTAGSAGTKTTQQQRTCLGVSAAGDRTPNTTGTELAALRTHGGDGGSGTGALGQSRGKYLTRPERTNTKRGGGGGVKYARYVSFVNGKAPSCGHSGGDMEGCSRSSHSSHSHSCSDVEAQLCEQDKDSTSGCGRTSGAGIVCGGGGGGGSNNSSRVVNNNNRGKRTPSPTSLSGQKVRIVIGNGSSSAGGGRGSSTRGRRPSDSALNSVTATLVAVVIFFLVLVSPSEMLKFSIAYTGASPCQEKMVLYVTNFMQVVNFSLNFVLYCAVNKTFRHTLHGLVCCCWLSITG